MPQSELDKLLDTFAEGSGYGDPNARRNAELRLQVLLAKEQQRSSTRLNWITLALVGVGLLQVVVLIVQLLK